MTQALVQGTPEWREARVGKITGSMIGAVLGVSPFTTRKRALRHMVEESLGQTNRYVSEAMQWGTEHEVDGVKLYDALYAMGKAVTETGFWAKGDLGASPDRLVGDDGLLEIKCPFSLREQTVPEFSSIDDLPHYYHQMQLQMLCTNRQWCDFLQWTPHDHKIERVMRDPMWLDNHVDDIAAFMGEYDELMEQMRTGGPADRLALSEGWAGAVEHYAEMLSRLEGAKQVFEDAKTNLLALVKAQALEEVDSDICKVQKVERVGSVQWKEVAAILGEDDPERVKQLAQEHKGKSSTYWKIDLKEAT